MFQHLVFIGSDEFSIVLIVHSVKVLINPVDIEIKLIFDVVERLEVVVHSQQTRHECLLSIFDSRRDLLLVYLFITIVIWEKDNLLFSF
jgi:hypothetical protein